jgi:hypothetical protein
MSISCIGRHTDSYLRMVAVCTFDGVDRCRWMVEQGQAIAYQKYSFEHVAEETRAKAVKVSVWAGELQHPSGFRHLGGRRSGYTQLPPGPQCSASWRAGSCPPETAAIGWDEPAPVWSDPEPSYAALPASEAEQFLTQAEIDTFTEVAWETAPVIEMKSGPDYDLRALPTPDEGDR